MAIARDYVNRLKRIIEKKRKIDLLQKARDGGEITIGMAPLLKNLIDSTYADNDPDKKDAIFAVETVFPMDDASFESALNQQVAQVIRMAKDDSLNPDFLRQLGRLSTARKEYVRRRLIRIMADDKNLRWDIAQNVEKAFRDAFGEDMYPGTQSSFALTDLRPMLSCLESLHKRLQTLEGRAPRPVQTGSI